MRVIQVTDYGSPYAGSFIPMLESAHRAVQSRGWESTIVLPQRARARDWTRAFAAAHEPFVVFAPDGGYREKVRWLEELVGAGGGGLTLLHSHFTHFDLPVSTLGRRQSDTLAIWHFQTVLSEKLAAKVRNRFRFAFASRSVARMLCVAPHLVEGVCARGAPRHKVMYFPNAVDTDTYRGPATSERRTAARETLGLEPSVRVLLHIGRDWHLKGGDLFLDAFDCLGDANLQGLMVRGGEEASREVRRRNLESTVRVIDGVPDVHRLYEASDLLLATSRGEGMPFTVAEALSGGLGVVATDIPGHAFPGGAPPGLRIASLTPEAIATQARGLLDRSPDEVLDEGRRSHQWIHEKLGLEAWAERLLGVYDSVMASRDSASV